MSLINLLSPEDSEDRNIVSIRGNQMVTFYFYQTLEKKNRLLRVHISECRFVVMPDFIQANLNLVNRFTDTQAIVETADNVRTSAAKIAEDLRDPEHFFIYEIVVENPQVHFTTFDLRPTVLICSLSYQGLVRLETF